MYIDALREAEQEADAGVLSAEHEAAVLLDRRPSDVPTWSSYKQRQVISTVLVFRALPLHVPYIRSKYTGEFAPLKSQHDGGATNWQDEHQGVETEAENICAQTVLVHIQDGGAAVRFHPHHEANDREGFPHVCCRQARLDASENSELEGQPRHDLFDEPVGRGGNALSCPANGGKPSAIGVSRTADCQVGQ